MVYVPPGSFRLGSGGDEVNAFYRYPLTTTGYLVNSESAITVGTGNGNLHYPSGTALAGDQFGPIPAAFPKGYGGFYMMKYELTQQDYKCFLNSLTRQQQDLRTATVLSVGTTTVTNRYVMANTNVVFYRNGIRCDAMVPATYPINFYCDMNGNGIGDEADDGQWVACNYLRWGDLAAYLDWSGLRPMTELEFEKACRGPLATVANEYAWGSTSVANAAYTLGLARTASEAIGLNYSMVAGNALYVSTEGTIDGPVRVGIFATTSTVPGRIGVGAGYYGVLNLSDNLMEYTISVGHALGRAFNGGHGDGQLDASGNANEATWPLPTFVGGGIRGGSWVHGATSMRVSDRSLGTSANWNGASFKGGRGVRAAP